VRRGKACCRGQDGQRLELSRQEGNKEIITLNIETDMSFSCSADTRFGHVCLKQINLQCLRENDIAACVVWDSEFSGTAACSVSPARCVSTGWTCANEPQDQDRRAPGREAVG